MWTCKKKKEKTNAYDQCVFDLFIRNPNPDWVLKVIRLEVMLHEANVTISNFSSIFLCGHVKKKKKKILIDISKKKKEEDKLKLNM